MPDRAFIDTNLLVYLYSASDKSKAEATIDALQSHECIISTQVLNELGNVLLGRKWKLAPAVVKQIIKEVQSISELMLVDSQTAEKAIDLHECYGFNYFDCLMLASALHAGCNVFLSEDMTNGMVVEDALTIKNIFV